MIQRHDLPPGLTRVRTTQVFNEGTVPTGLLNAHRIADRVWGLLVVHSGALKFIFEDSTESSQEVVGGESFVIPPGRPHHLSISGPVTFVIEFHRQPRPNSESGPA